MGYDATRIEQYRFEKFTESLTAISKKYGIILDVTGGVTFLDPTDPCLQRLAYSNDATSGDLNSRNWYKEEDDNYFTYLKNGRLVTTRVNVDERGTPMIHQAQQDETNTKGTKIDKLIKKLSSKNGTTLEEMVKITAWQPHTIRATMANLKKQRNLNIESRQLDNGKRLYRICQA